MSQANTASQDVAATGHPRPGRTDLFGAFGDFQKGPVLEWGSEAKTWGQFRGSREPRQCPACP